MQEFDPDQLPLQTTQFSHHCTGVKLQVSSHSSDQEIFYFHNRIHKILLLYDIQGSLIQSTYTYLLPLIYIVITFFTQCLFLPIFPLLVLIFYLNICTVHRYFLYNEPTNAQLIYNLLYCSLLHCPYRFRRYCVIFRELVVNTS